MSTGPLRLLTLNVTATCDAACWYCHWWRMREPHPPLASLLEAVDEAAAAGVRVLRISGGEPMLRNDLPTLVRTARERDFVVMICTGGQQEFEDLRAVINAGVDILSISIDLLDPEVFQRLRGYSLAPVLANLERLAGLRAHDGFEIIVSTVLTRLNVDRLEGLIGLVRCLDLLWSVTPFQGGEPGRRSPMARLAFTAADATRIETAVDNLRRVAGDGVRLVNGDRFFDGFAPFLTARQLPQGHVCQAGDSGAIRMVDGSVKLCHSLAPLSPGPLSQVWISADAQDLRSRMLRLECPRCWLSCHADERRSVAIRFGQQRILEAL